MKKLSILLSVALMALLLVGTPVYATDAPAEEPAETTEAAEPVETTEAAEPVETTTTETTTTEVTQEIEQQIERDDVLFGLDMTTLLLIGAGVLLLIILLASRGRDRDVHTNTREVHTNTREVIDRDPITPNDRVVRKEETYVDENGHTVVREERIVDDHDDTIKR